MPADVYAYWAAQPKGWLEAAIRRDMEIGDLIEQITNPTVREWARANPELVLAALEAEYLKAHPEASKANLEERNDRE